MKKLNLDELKVKSFVTSMENNVVNTVKGGNVKVDPLETLDNNCPTRGAFDCDYEDDTLFANVCGKATVYC